MHFDKSPSMYEKEKKELFEKRKKDIISTLEDKTWKIKQKYEEKETPTPFEILKSWNCDFDGFGCLLIILYPIGITVLLVACIVALVLWIKNSLYNLPLSRKIEVEIKKANENACSQLERYKKFILEEIENYKNSFEEEKNKLSIKYAKSEKVNEVAGWLTKKFLKYIESADRSIHVENVIVKFNLTICEGGIYYDGGETWDMYTRYYDFTKHRCEKMPELTYRAALATALASQIQTNTMMQYKKDASGSEYDIDINFPDDYDPKSQLVYTAANGNFKPVQKW